MIAEAGGRYGGLRAAPRWLRWISSRSASVSWARAGTTTRPKIALPRATSAGLPKGAGRVWCACAGIVESINKSQFACFSLLAGFSRVLARRKTRNSHISPTRSRVAVGPARAYLSHGHRAIEYRISYRAERAPRRPAPWPKPSEQRAATGRPASPTPRSRRSHCSVNASQACPRPLPVVPARLKPRRNSSCVAWYWRLRGLGLRSG